MHIPSRVEVLSWNENQVADLLREHKLLDCVDCVFQRHIDGQKLLNLKEGEVLYFLEIHDEKSRGKFWNIVKRITEKRGGVANLMNKFQVNNESNNNTVEEDDNEFDDDSDSFDDDVSDDYDEPEEDNTPVGKPVSLERQETIKRNLMGLINIAPPSVAPTTNYEDEHSSYPTSEEIYDVPEDGCGEPDDELYDVPSDESGGGVVTRHPALERRESDQYLVPDNTKLIELSQTIDEEDYEDLGGAPPPMGRHSELDLQEEYVVPDTKPAAVPPRPPKPSADSNHKPQKAAPVENGHRKPAAKNSSINQLRAMFQEQPTNDPPEPQRDLKKPLTKKPPPNIHTPVSEPPKPYPPKDFQKTPAKPPHVLKKVEKKLPPEVPDVQENYELPSKPPPITKNKKPPNEPEQETYEPPDQPPRQPKKPAVNKKPPVEIQQDNYEAPETPVRQAKKPAVNKKPPVEIQQDNYEAPETPLRPSKPKSYIPEPMQDNYEPPEPQRRSKPAAAPVQLDPEENYEAPDLAGMNQTQEDADEPEEDYEIPDTSEIQKEVVQESPKKFPFKKLFNRSPSKKVPPSAPPKLDKRKTKTNNAPVPSTSPAVPEIKEPPARQSPNLADKKSRVEKTVPQRSSMILPPLPSQGSTSPSLPPKPFLSSEKPPHNKPVPTPAHRRIPDLPPSKPPHMTKEQLLQEQPWFHGTISKAAVAEFLKSAKKDGAYLVRNSSRDQGKYTISIYYKNDIRHLNIPCENGHYRLGESGVERFKSIEELVSYFNKHDVEFSAGGKTPLTHACMKQGPPR